jgi:sortase A
MKPRASRWGFLDTGLLVVSVLALSWYALGRIESTVYQAWQGRVLDAQLRDEIRGLDEIEQSGVPHGEVLGRLEIPRLALSVVIREGEDPRTLRLAVGHLPGTAWPGRPGNSAIAGHRDTFFRKLRHIEPHDDILVRTSAGVSRYVVVSTRIVEPEDVSVLKSNGEPILTLVTCYPFFHVGSAPQRFIVRAVLAPHPATAHIHS